MKDSYVNLGIDLFEFLYFPQFTKTSLEKFIRFTNLDLVEKLRSANRGVIFLSGHYSNWELTAFAYSKIFNQRLSIIAKIQASKGLNEKINGYRSLPGNEIIEIGFSLKHIFRRLKENSIVCFLIDQSAHPDYSVYINFFGRRVPAFSGPAKIALRERPGLLISRGVRNKDYSYDIIFEELKYDDLKDNSEESVKELTQRMQSMFESVIRHNPGQWLWFHKRFKHKKN